MKGREGAARWSRARVTIAGFLITGFLPPRGFSLCCKTLSPLCAIKVASVDAGVPSGRALRCCCCCWFGF